MLDCAVFQVGVLLGRPFDVLEKGNVRRSSPWRSERDVSAIHLFVGYGSWSISAFLDKRLVVFAARSRVNSRPARFTIVLQTGNVSAKKRRELASASCALAFVTHLVVQDVGLYLDL